MSNAAIAGMNYEQASKEGCRLIEQATKTGQWHGIVDDLVALRDLMQDQKSGSSNSVLSALASEVEMLKSRCSTIEFRQNLSHGNRP